MKIKKERRRGKKNEGGGRKNRGKKMKGTVRVLEKSQGIARNKEQE